MQPDKANPNQPGMVEVHGFELYERLGEGTMGVVFRARHLLADQIVALKVLYPVLAGNATYLQRFRAEADAARPLDHPNLVKVFGYGQRGQTHFICMEFVDGSNLRDVLRREGALPEPAVVVVGMCVASALHYAWEKTRLVHRDVKPENLLLSTNGSLKLCDLGIAKRMAVQQGDGVLTRTGCMLGTPHYVAPEQLKGTKALDCRVDIYSLGATLYHAVTGRTIHQADTEFGLLLKQATEPVKDPRAALPGLNDKFAELLMQMLELDLNKRPANWLNVYDTLAAINEELTAGDAIAQIRISSIKRHGAEHLRTRP